MLTREPGGTDIGEKIRDLFLDDSAKSMLADTELLLMFASRNEHIKTKIMPVLAQGGWVLSDRFVDSSYAYQGGGRKINAKRIAQIEKWIMGHFKADMTILLDVGCKIGGERINLRDNKNRIELEGADFFNRVRTAFIKRAKQFPERIKLIDSSKTITETQHYIKILINKLGGL